MDRTIKYIVQDDYAGLSIKDFLKRMHYSAQSISDQKHFEDGIMHNKQRAYVNEALMSGDELVINCHEVTSSEKIPPVPMKLDILYEDEDVVIVNKPADMPVHPSLNNYENTLANGLADYYESQGQMFVFRCMNRLDRNTTGAVLVAKNPISGAMLSEMIRERKIEKEYVAIAEGKFKPGITKPGIVYRENLDNGCDKSIEFIIDAPIARVEGSTIERCVDFDRGERAVTHVRVLEVTKSENTFVSCKLETGRTHQIRVHMAYIGHPLIEDGMYNPSCADSGDGQMLHCRKLEFVQPITGEKISVEAPLPDRMQEYFD